MSDNDFISGIIFIDQDDHAYAVPGEIIQQHKLSPEHLQSLKDSLDEYFDSHSDNFQRSSQHAAQPYALFLADDIDPDTFIPTIDSASGEEP